MREARPVSLPDHRPIIRGADSIVLTEQAPCAAGLAIRSEAKLLHYSLWTSESSTVTPEAQPPERQRVSLPLSMMIWERPSISKRAEKGSSTSSSMADRSFRGRVDCSPGSWGDHGRTTRTFWRQCARPWSQHRYESTGDERHLIIETAIRTIPACAWPAPV